MLEITKEKLDGLFKMADEVKAMDDVTSEQVRTAKAQNSERTHKFTREGKEVEIPEKVLWEEMYYLGKDSEAGNKMRETYPEMFEQVDKQNKIVQHLKMYIMGNFGVDYTAMTFTDWLRIMEALIDYKAEKK
jgi:hypothetical protein